MMIDKNGYDHKVNSRGKFLFFLLSLSFIGVLSRVAYLQFFIGDKLKNYSNNQFIRKTKVYSDRGRIFDRNGKSLAINISKYNIFTMPKELSENKKEIKFLSEIVPSLKVKKLLKNLKDRKKFTWLGRKLDLTKKQLKQIEGLQGIYTEKIFSREANCLLA